jgi:hypothetical protein
VFREIGLVVGGVRADDVDDGSIRPAGIVQHGDAVGEAAGDVQEGEGWCALHAPVPVRGTGDDVLLQTQDGTHLVGHADFIDELHLGCAGVRKAGRDPRIHQRLE